MQAITRSGGTVVHGFVVGGGYEGLTKELDATVAQEAEALSKAFGRDVEIRFNSDRNSGGAWLADSLQGFTGNCQVGLTAALVTDWPSDMSLEEYRRREHELPKELRISTMVDQSALIDPDTASQGTDARRYSWRYHETVNSALRWLVANVDKSKLYS